MIHEIVAELEFVMITISWCALTDSLSDDECRALILEKMTSLRAAFQKEAGSYFVLYV